MKVEVNQSTSTVSIDWAISDRLPECVISSLYPIYDVNGLSPFSIDHYSPPIITALNWLVHKDISSFRRQNQSQWKIQFENGVTLMSAPLFRACAESITTFVLQVAVATIGDEYGAPL